MKKIILKAWVLLIMLAVMIGSVALDLSDLKSSKNTTKEKTGTAKKPPADDNDEEGPTPAKKNEFFPAVWKSLKKGWGLSDEEIDDEVDKEIREEVNKEAEGFEDPVKKTMEERKKELDAKVANQDIIAQAAKAAKELALIWAQKEVNKYINNEGSPALISAIPSSSRAGLSRQEKDFRALRQEKTIRPALQKFLGEDISSQMIRESSIAFAGTGGGYRAMILTTGYLNGLEQIGLLNGITYVAGLSGSSWMIGPWISTGGTVQDFKKSLLAKIQDKKFNVMKVGPGILSSSENLSTITKYILWPKYLWGQPIRSIDFYGYLLGQVLLGKDGYKKHLSDQLINVKTGNYPFPIYSAVSMSKKDDDEYSYDWYEFNPVEVLVNFRKSGDEKDRFLSVPVRAFGSEFNAGKSISTGHVTVAPEQIFGYWLGTYGSAFAINSKDINDYVSRGLSKLPQSLTSMDGIMSYVGASLVGVLQSLEGVGSARISPAQIFNPFKGYTETPIKWLKQKKYLTLVDAGVSNNIPLQPLLWPERKIKFIIIGESSTTVASARELKNFFEYAKDLYGYDYERIDDGKNLTLRLYKAKDNTQAPRIIYLTYLKEPKLMALTGPGGVAKLTTQEKLEREKLRRFINEEKLDLFDPVACIEGKDGKAFCHTLNFEYTTDQFKQLSGMAEFNVMANKEVIAKFIREELDNEEVIDFPSIGAP